MYFNFEENHPDTPRLASYPHRSRAVLLTVVVYLVVVIAVLVVPKTDWYKAQVLAKEQDRIEQLQRSPEGARERRFVFMAPKVEMHAPRAAQARRAFRHRSSRECTGARVEAGEPAAVLARQ